MNEVGFLDFYIAALITGSILGMDRELLKKAAVRFLPVSFLSMAVAALMAGIVGILTGQGFRETVLYIAMPMMSGGMVPVWCRCPTSTRTLSVWTRHKSSHG